MTKIMVTQGSGMKIKEGWNMTSKGLQDKEHRSAALFRKQSTQAEHEGWHGKEVKGPVHPIDEKLNEKMLEVDYISKASQGTRSLIGDGLVTKGCNIVS